VNVFGLPKLRDVPIGHHERAVKRVHSRVVVPQRPDRIGVQTIGIGVVRGGTAPSVTRFPTRTDWLSSERVVLRATVGRAR
jgi:hypothetical protein